MLASPDLEIVRLGIPRLGTWRKQKQGFDEKVIWIPMALRIGLQRSSALQNDGLDSPVILQCRAPQETNPEGHWGPHYFFIQSLFLLPPCTQSWYTQAPHPLIFHRSLEMAFGEVDSICIAQRCSERVEPDSTVGHTGDGNICAPLRDRRLAGIQDFYKHRDV